MLEIAHVAKHYDAVGRDGVPEVLRDVSLTVNAGESVAIVGPSGSGKSTLLNIVGGLDSPSGGTVTLEGRDLASLDADTLAAVRNRRIGFVFQTHHLLPQCTALENVLVPTLADRGADANANATRARALLERVGLGDRIEHRPGQLSGGECQRVAVVRALINEPAVVLADEPTGSLDATAAAALGGLLADLARTDDIALIAVTHSPELAARMQRVLVLRDGTLEAAS